MPRRIVDLSARSEVVRDEPFQMHFWACTPAEYRAYLGRPREFLRKLGIVVPPECRIETSLENHDWLEDEAPDFEGENDTVISNVGIGAGARAVYRVVSFARDEADTGRIRKSLLHGAEHQQVEARGASKKGKKKKPGKSAKGKAGKADKKDKGA